MSAQAQLQSNLENRFSRSKNKLSKQLASTAESLEEVGETLAEHQDAAEEIKADSEEPVKSEKTNEKISSSMIRDIFEQK